MMKPTSFGFPKCPWILKQWSSSTFLALLNASKIQMNSYASQTFCGSAKHCNAFKWPGSIFCKSHLVLQLNAKHSRNE
jgi:hypothetical protein